jgi:ABC-type Na+ efflux pump permease subunit
MSFKRQFLPVKVFAKVSIRRAFRDKTAIFFIFLFPLIFLFVFGAIFGKNNDTSFRVALINQSDSQFAKQYVEEAKTQKVLKIDEQATTTDKANEKMSRGQLDATIILPADFGQMKEGQPYPSGQAQIIYTQNNQQAGQTLASVMQQQFSSINSKFVTIVTPFSVKAEQSNQKALTQFD